MSMSYREAMQIAFDPLGEHATTTLDCAERVLKERHVGERNRVAHIQLANLKARLQRIIGWSDYLPAEKATLEAISLIAHDHKSIRKTP